MWKTIPKIELKTQNQSVNTVRASDETLYIIWIGGNDYLDSITSKSRVLNFYKTQNKSGAFSCFKYFPCH